MNKPLIKFLSEAGNRQILQKTENFYLQDQAKEMPTVDEALYFIIEEKQNYDEVYQLAIAFYPLTQEIRIKDTEIEGNNQWTNF